MFAGICLPYFRHLRRGWAASEPTSVAVSMGCPGSPQRCGGVGDHIRSASEATFSEIAAREGREASGGNLCASSWGAARARLVPSSRFPVPRAFCSGKGLGRGRAAGCPCPL